MVCGDHFNSSLVCMYFVPQCVLVYLSWMFLLIGSKFTYPVVYSCCFSDVSVSFSVGGACVKICIVILFMFVY